MSILKVKNLSKVYEGTTSAIENISFDVNEKELVTIIGPSGAGKSTILRCINKLIDYTDGDIEFNNKSIKDVKKNDLRKLRTNIGMIFQHYNLVERLSVIENVLHGRLGYKSSIKGALGIYSEKEKEDAFKILEKVGLQDQAYKRCDKLSGGQKQRVGIARALIQNPKLLLCDEPIASLDPNSSKVIMDQIKEINKSLNITCILNLHQVDVAINYSDRIIGINGGKLVFDGKPKDLTKEKIHEIYGSDYGNLIID
ncbi:MAG: phosphonate ABC transporter ATP-binding protein [Clostridiales bacterium]|nr:phosphonate ABC transporter ATP-binding protein [Clostridiales bacterium]